MYTHMQHTTTTTTNNNNDTNNNTTNDPLDACASDFFTVRMARERATAVSADGFRKARA